MKTTIDIPDAELEAALRFTGAKTKREAVVTALADYNRRQHLAKVAASVLGTSETFMTPVQLMKRRMKRRIV